MFASVDSVNKPTLHTISYLIYKFSGKNQHDMLQFAYSDSVHAAWLYCYSHNNNSLSANANTREGSHKCSTELFRNILAGIQYSRVKSLIYNTSCLGHYRCSQIIRGYFPGCRKVL
jgi:hypothetical protein